MSKSSCLFGDTNDYYKEPSNAEAAARDVFAKEAIVEVRK